MSQANETAITVLNNLVETCRDGQEGFRTAAEHVKDPQLKQLFMTYAQQRAQFITELQGEIRRLGDDPDRSGSVAGALHRGWMNIRSAVSGGDDRAIVAEAERGEDAAKTAYEDALQRGLPTAARGLVEQQYARVTEAHDRVRALRERAA
ncbi:MAG: ferritin-like domain-containing protein [Candidatus Rokuibacteriota bacterium]